MCCVRVCVCVCVVEQGVDGVQNFVENAFEWRQGWQAAVPLANQSGCGAPRWRFLARPELANPIPQRVTLEMYRTAYGACDVLTRNASSWQTSMERPR